MSNLIKIDNNYRKWIQTVCSRFRQSQLKASIKVNEEMLQFFWSLGKDMEEKRATYAWGTHFYSQLSSDLKAELPEIKSFSPRNLLYMHQFFRLYSGVIISPQVDAQFNNNEIAHQLDAQFEDFPIFHIPWGHHKLLIDKCQDNPKKALFYISKVYEYNWTRAVLLNFLETNLYEREGKAVTNFYITLPKPQSNLAQEITRDPYKFDFLTIREKYDEKELKEALMDNITRFLLELGNGFAFVGREYRLEIGETENFIDMLFYNIKLHCYVVVEIKIREFDPGDMGQLGTYMVAVNHQLKGEMEGPTLGLLICRSKDNVKARYALEASSQPMEISKYDIDTFIPEEFKSSLPTIEEIESELEEFPKTTENE